MKTVITYGTYDLLHHGHIRILRRLKGLGERLVVGLSTDQFNEQKGKKTVFRYEHRAEILESIVYVDKVFPEVCWDQKRDDILREYASIFAMGDDWAGRFDDLQDIVEVIYLPRTLDVSTTDLKAVLSNFDKETAFLLRNSLEQALESVNKIIKA